MRRSDVGHRLVLAVLLGSLLCLPVMPVAATVSLDIETAYGGVDADSQAVETTVSLSPEGNAITDATVNIRETDQGFIDEESFTTTVDPSSADAGLTYEGAGRYTIEELEPGETVAISFAAYPRTVKQASLDVATVEVAYVQQGQDLTERGTVQANLTSSSYFELQRSQERVAQLEGTVQERQWLTYLSVGLIGLIVLGLGYRFVERTLGGFGEADDGDGGSRFE